MEEPGPPVAWFGHADRPPPPRALAHVASAAAGAHRVPRRHRLRGHRVGRRVPRHPLRADRPRSRTSTSTEKAGEAANYLLVGTDSREGLDPNDPDAGGFLGDAGCDCTDTIMVLRVDPEEKQAYLLSFPRDLYLPIAGTGDTARINTAHAHGEQTLIDTITENFGIPINHYVEIDFVGFEQLVDAVGGVPLWFDAPVRDRHTGLDVQQSGCVELDGEQARKFVRSRYLEYQDEDGDWDSDPTADLGRITRQQVFVRRAVAKAVSQGLSNPITLNDLVSAGVANVSLDEQLDAGDLLAIGEAFSEYDSDDLKSYSIPSEPMNTSAGAKVQLPLMARRRRCSTSSAGCRPAPSPQRASTSAVLNGTGVTGQAADAAGAWDRSASTSSTSTSYATEDVGRTTVRYGYYGEPAARRVAAHITGGAALVLDDNLGLGEVILVTGSDFTTVHDQPTPEGSADDQRTTTSTTAPTSTSTTAPGETTTSSTVPTTTTTVIGYSTGEPPDGVDC